MSVQGIFQCLARTELWNLGGLDLDGFAGAGVAARTSSALTNGECAKTNERHCTTLFEGFLHSLNRGIQCTSSRSLGDVGVVSDVLNQFGFIHKMPLEK